MDNFMEQVEYHLRSKSLRELKGFITKIASKVPASSQRGFLSVLENKRVSIDKKSDSKSKAQNVLKRVKTFLDEVENYEIEAYYDDGGWYDEESFNIKDDDGFVDEFSHCYNAAELLLSEAQFKEAAEAFRLLFEAIDKFNEHNENHDFGELRFDTFIDEGLLTLDLRKAKALRGYSALMSEAVDLRGELEYIYELCDTHDNRLMFKEVLEAGNMPVPNLENVLVEWLSVLFERNPQRASTYVKEAAELSGDISIMENYAKTIGVAEPVVYLDLLEMLRETNATPEKLIKTATEGLANTAVDAKKRDSLASRLANTAKEIGDQDVYTYAILERFYSRKNLDSYLPVFELGIDSDANQSATQALKPPAGDTYGQRAWQADYHIIHLLNRHYDTVFDAIKTYSKSLGWSGSLKGALFPFFLGLTVGFSEEALMIQKLIKESVTEADGAKVYKVFGNSIGLITREQDSSWQDFCVREARNRVDAIVSGTYRGSYFKAARLLVVICEVQLYKKEIGGKADAFAILHEYRSKYPRHSAFRSELKAAAQEAKL